MHHQRSSVVAGSLVIISVAVIMLGGKAYTERAVVGLENNLTATTIRAAKTVFDLSTHYASGTQTQAQTPGRKLKILIVPGHEPESGGAEFKGVYERDVVVDIADNLARYLKQNSAYGVMISRDKTAWNPILQNYFDTQAGAIVAWRDQNKTQTALLRGLGQMDLPTVAITHARAPEDSAIRLYGINKWSDENDYDLVIHLHINDYPRSNVSQPGEHTGFTIYVPDRQYQNSNVSTAVAKKIYARLAAFYPTSDLAGESTGVVDDSELIAIGADNSQSAASMLIEYGYVYEPQFTHAELRAAVEKDLAYQTYLGIQDFFDATASSTKTVILPHTWDQPITKGTEGSLDVLALQTALIEEGLYPPSDKGLSDCPRSGKLGPCSLEALAAFQSKFGISGEPGVVGEKTLDVLNQLYSK